MLLMQGLNFCRDHLELFEQMARHRGITLDLEGFRALDRERRELITAAERLKAERNKASEEIARRKKSGQDAAGLIAEMKRVSEEIKQYDERIAQLDERTREFLLTVPNLPHPSVPVGQGEQDNVEVRRWGAAPKFSFTPTPPRCPSRAAPGRRASARRPARRARTRAASRGSISSRRSSCSNSRGRSRATTNLSCWCATRKPSCSAWVSTTV